MKRSFLYFFAIVILLNFTQAPQFLGLEPAVQTYRYTAMTGTEFTEIPAKGIEIDFEHPGLKRKFKMHFWKVWKWREYLIHKRWRLEYSE